MEIWQKYLDSLDEKKRLLVLKTLYTAGKFAPGSNPAMPYGVPGLKYKGKNLIAVAAHKNHLGIYPFSPKVVKEVVKQFDIDYSEGTLKFDYDRPPVEDIIKKIVYLRVGEF